MKAGVPAWCVRAALFGALFLGSCGAGWCDEIDIASFGVITEGMPYAVALDRGFFKAHGLDITGVRSSPGGGTDIRQLLAGNLPYTESSLPAVVTANQQGADLKIVSDNIRTVSDFVWVVMPNSPVRSLKDFRGKRIAFTNPQGTAQALEFWLLQEAGLTQNDAKLVAAGGFPQSLTALETGGVDIAATLEPLYTLSKGKFRPVVWARDVFPPMASAVGVTTAAAARDKPQVIRGIIAARREAVEFMAAHRAEAAASIAKYYKIDPKVIETVMSNLIDHGSVHGAPFWGLGDIHYEDFNNMERAMKLVGVIHQDVDWSTMVDDSFLPPNSTVKK